MNVRMNGWLLLLLLGLMGPMRAWGQGASVPSATSLRSTVADSSGMSRSMSSPKGKAVRNRVDKQPSVPRIQIPKRAQLTTAVLIFFSAAFGAVLFISLFTFAQFLLNRDAPYGWYALYLVTTAIWLGQSTHIWLTGTAQPPDPAGFFAYMLLLKYGMIVSYVRFIGHLLEVPQLQPRLHRWTRYFVWLYTVSVLALAAESFMWRSTHTHIGIDVLTYAGLLFLISRMLRLRHPLMRYVLLGFGLILSGAMTATFLRHTSLPTTDQLVRMPMFYIAVTALLEILCFSLALGRRFQLNKDETIRTQQQLIGQFEANRQLQQTHRLDLEQKLAQREADVLSKAHELEEQRVSQLQSDFDRRAAEAEMAGLRSQMNPHFIFNCLNSIKLYAIENDSEKASDYLTRFSRLIRLVLENARSERVTLQNELETLRLYMDMEAMRFKQKLSFHIDIAPDIDAKFLEIPPLLIQPYVENAIWHGLMHKPEGGTVQVRATLPQETMLQLTITDDGVGRTRAAELKSKSASHRKSFGLKMTSERISLVNQLYHTHTQVMIHDLIDASGQPAGTEVVLQIPV